MKPLLQGIPRAIPAASRGDLARHVVFSLLATCVIAVPCRAELGLLTEAGTGVVVFEASTRHHVGVVPIDESGTGVAGCSISADQELGYVTDFESRVWVVEPKRRRLALGTNPIPISSTGLDTALTHDERFLLVCGGNAPGGGPVSVVDVASRSEVDAYSLGPAEPCLSVEACSDGSVLATSAGAIHRLQLDETGRLSHSGDVLAGGFFLQNVDCTSGDTGVAIRREVDAEVQSFELSGATPLDRRVLSSRGAIGNTALASRATGTLYALTSFGSLELFDYDARSGAIGAKARSSLTPGEGAGSSMFGIDTMALTADGRKLFVVRGGVHVVDARTGRLLSSFLRPSEVHPRGICLPRVEPVQVDVDPEDDDRRLSPLSDEEVTVAVLGSAEFDVADVEVDSLSFGPSAAEPTEEAGVAVEDVNDDGFEDLVSRYVTFETGIAFGDSEACASGTTVEGVVFQGCDAIATIGRPAPAEVGADAAPSGSACGVGFELALVLPPLMWLRRRLRARP